MLKFDVKQAKEAEDSHAFMRSLMTLHEQYKSVVRDCFNDAQPFQKALKEAFEDFINQVRKHLLIRVCRVPIDQYIHTI